MSTPSGPGSPAGRSAPAPAPRAPPAPLIAPTGSPGVNVVADVVNATVAPFESAPPPNQGVAGLVSQKVGGVLAVVGAPAKIIDTAFAELTAPIAAVFPSMPAVTLGAMHLGPPHAHTHPPSLIPPAPPVPLPSLGPVMGAGSVTVMIGGMPAARAGDIGISVTCGSLAPPFEISTGSSNVFIGGARAARVLDITKHCNPTAEGPFAIAMAAAGAVVGVAGAIATSNAYAAAQVAADAATMALKLLCGKDPGVPPGMGMLMGPPVPNVLIGGFPCPPVGQMAVGALLKALKAAGSLLKRGSPEEANGSCGNAGEPVYVVTGENFTKARDFASDLFEWRRHYTSARSRDDGPLGHGWRHFYQRTLRVRLHRASFVDWTGLRVDFPPFEYGSDVSGAAGRVLRRLGPGRYRLSYRAQPELEFVGDEFAADLRLSRVTTAEREVTLEYDALSRLTAAVERDKNGARRRRFELRYDAGGHVGALLEVRVPRAPGARPESVVRARYEYDARSDLRDARDALGGRWSYECDAFHRIVKTTDPRQYTYAYRYDALGRCTHTVGQDGLWSTAIEYFPEKQLSRVTAGDGGIWEVHYDGDGVVTEIVDPLEGRKVRERDGAGRLAREVDCGGRVTRWLYDGHEAHHARVDRFGNLFAPEVEAPSPPSPFARNLPATAFERLFSGCPSGPSPTTFGAEPSVLSLVDPELHAKTRLCLRLRSDREPSVSSGPSSAIERDDLGRKIRETDVFGRIREWQFDAAGNLVAERDRDGRVRTRTTTSWNLVGERRDALGHPMRYRYSSIEQVVGVVDPLGNETGYEYDRKERLVRVYRHGRLHEEYVYDAGDHFVEKRDGSGATLFSNEIHENHFVKVRRLASGGVHVFDYDARGRITRASTGEHDVALGYDAWGRSVLDLRDGVGVETRFRHDNGSEREGSRREVFERFEFVASRSRNATRLVNPTGKETRLVCRDDGVVVRRCSNGTTELLQYDADGRLVGRLLHRRDEQGRLTSWATAYAYTAEGDLVHRDDSASGATSFEVDVAHRLVAEIDRHGNRRQYWHDAAGNVRLAWMEIGAGNRLVRAADERFSYDERHRLSVRTRADGSSIRYAYDSFDLLTRVERSGPEGSPESGPAGDDAWSASYDAIGRRIRAGTVGRKRDFYWDGDRLAAEVGPEGRLRIYDYATPAALVPLGFVEYETAAAPPGDGATYHVFSDPSGMPLRIEDEEGSVVWRAERISPFGGVDVRPGATLEYNLRWPGHYHDPETGLHYNRYRYYDPKLARYLQGDPTGYAGSPVNLYAYCANPLVHVDIRGLHDDLPKKGSSDEEDGEPDGRESPPQPSKEDLAASTENTPETRAARDALARDFYRTHCPGMSEAEIDSHVRCIDMDHPVKVVTIPPGGDGANGDQLYSWVAPGQGRPGQYFANDPATQPDALGANPRVIAPASGDTPQRVTPREQRTYAADPNQPATGLQSVAAPANDTWSVSGGSYSPESGDVPYQAPGGGTQVMVPRSQQGGFSQVDDD